MVETLPLFPLGTVLLPGASLPLHIFEPRYRQLTIDLVTGTLPGKQFGVVAVREGWSPDDGRNGLHDVGCTATLREVRRLPDGRFDIQTTGDRRFRLVDVDDASAPYLVGTVEWLPDDEDGGTQDLAPLAMAARAAHRRYCTTAWRQQGGGDGELPAELAEEPAPDVADPELAHLLAGDCLLPLADRQELLEQTCPIKRLQLVRQSMTREAVLLDELRAVWAPSAKFAVEHSLN
ncbi:LON peptidase substrate-binding domain-containing protein [Actinomycetospora rhizophila]|uniref:LON peptidase substrate-binding domain-containing protein n=1 Tax=Actinomycetospora rhizophila TaxID=1416876 RepID=A0ABV9ZMT1_9PSEU